jgi:glycosyltransferase involved in cell wall biosynthesis
MTSQRFRRRVSHLTTLILLLFLTYRIGSNLRFLRWLRRQASSLPVQHPCVSVLVPARNEAATITPCVISLLNQDYPDIEVIVLDDASTDDTGVQLDALAKSYPRLKVIHARDNLPTGWNGKSYACHRLSEQATGEWLLFTDADTEHTAQSVAQGIAQAIALDAHLLSAFPFQQTLTWSEQIAVSFIVDFLPLLGLDLRAIASNEGVQAAANGQYLLVRASSYRQAGGHEAVYNELLDDFALARLFRANGYKIALVDGKEMLQCRMYHNARELWQGFSRSLMHGLSGSSISRRSFWWVPLFAWGYASLFVNPFYRLFVGEQRWLSLLEVVWLGILRGTVNWYLKRSMLEILTTPLAAWSVMALEIGAIYRRWQRQTIAWKGRSYMD